MAECLTGPDAAAPGAAPPSAGAPAGGPADPFLDLYKLAVEMADRVSARRATANGFFLTLNTALLSAIGLAPRAESTAPPDRFAGVLLALAGLLLVGTWWVLLRSYRHLNGAKFGVINAMETRLPAQVFTDEWRILRPEPPPSLRQRYLPLGTIERVVPLVYAVIYAAVLLRAFVA